ncbi:SDR family oxidoreductase [Gordonia sp. TBRC 11910]|uniref:SDR family oxidoreductase n=1 Tax=Gordonia asplenii TaxID=2725283 RepID=A0A848KZE4_9ACTN|nr:SDR family oxidoreductase [Gordonia asplenii]NMO03582.1 SDR family oxidoreductase [Gordonia asplenii]
MKSTTLHGKRIIITGGARGIGLATATAVAQHGATVVIGDLDQQAIDAAVVRIGSAATGFTVDVADRESFAAFYSTATESGPIDVLINNAGIMPIGSFLDQRPDTYLKAINVNVLGAMNGMHIALPDMIAAGSGHIINVASTAGKTPVPGGLAYCASKSAVVAMTETARVEFADSGVEFTCVMPHFTNTELIAGTTATKLVPVVEPSDVADAIAAAIDRPRADVFVPKAIGVILRTQPLMGRTVRDEVSRRLGAYNAFLDFDAQARAGYAERIAK